MADDLLTEEVRAAGYRTQCASRAAFQAFLQQSTRGSQSAYHTLFLHQQALLPPFNLSVSSYPKTESENDNNGQFGEPE